MNERVGPPTFFYAKQIFITTFFSNQDHPEEPMVEPGLPDVFFMYGDQ
jgi:hypothetical protein